MIVGVLPVDKLIGAEIAPQAGSTACHVVWSTDGSAAKERRRKDLPGKVPRESG
jgi:hypothetical protein